MIVEFDELSVGDIFESRGLRFMILGNSSAGVVLMTPNQSSKGTSRFRVFLVDRESMDDEKIFQLESWDEVIPDEEEEEDEDGCCDGSERHTETYRKDDLRALMGELLLDINDGSQYMVISYKETESLGPMVFLAGEGWKTRKQIDDNFAICVKEESCPQQH